ncbi:MAG: hypothetical protein HQM12_06375 [SAR324 cluster bacterium]|nr:hypothetical protein [SAR324 cluster bacterium]
MNETSDSMLNGNLISLFKNGIDIPAKNEQLLRQRLVQGWAFYENVNSARLQIALESFTDDMRKALYEVLYFLHENKPEFTDVSFRGTKIQHISGIVRESVYQGHACLYFPDAPSGLKGFTHMPKILEHSFFDYIQQEFGQSSFEDKYEGPIVSVSSLGSIGTIGHKPYASDLDLQILYELTPFRFDLNEWNNQRLQLAMQTESHYWFLRFCAQQQLVPELLLQRYPLQYETLRREATEQVARHYPNLYPLLGEPETRTTLSEIAGQGVLRQNLIHEISNLIQQNYQITHESSFRKAESLLKQRIQAIEQYVQAKFPTVELHLFVCSCEAFRLGQHGTTLESKEASGSAYELILNYEVLMPGIQFLPVVPMHYLLPQKFNVSRGYYERVLQYIRFHCLPLYEEISPLLMDQGPVSHLGLSYMQTHMGAAYWEAFKATSGNLPKSLLNLLRIETMYHPEYLYTIIELIKYPSLINERINAILNHEQPTVNQRIKKGDGLQIRELVRLEQSIPALKMDPWWLKYKILKVFYQDPITSIDPSERRKISRNIDLCFALHIKLSDAFGEPKTDGYREKFLKEFLTFVFPEKSWGREYMESLFRGEVRSVDHFEADLRDLFANCLDRIHASLVAHNMPDLSNRQEFDIWFHYYQQHFIVDSKMIRRNILTHLKTPRELIRIMYKTSRIRGHWIFLQSAHEHNPGSESPATDVELLVETSFLKGIASCILNGYYGLTESRDGPKKTRFELDVSTLNIRHLEDHWSMVDSELISIIADRIVALFPYQKHSYLECIQSVCQITEAFFFINLFHFGTLSVLCRDNLRNWWIEDYAHPSLQLAARELYDNPAKLMNHPELNTTIKAFLKQNRIKPGDPGLRLDFWYNPMSINQPQFSEMRKREKLSSRSFRDAFIEQHASTKINLYG